MEYLNTIDEHKRTPEISLNAHVRNKQLELSAYVLRHKTIYLDTNYWLTLRKVELGELTDYLSRKYHELINALSDNGVCIFPISESTFLEVLKQSDQRTLDCTVSIIDKLSRGISLISYNERVMLETLHFIEDKIGCSTYSPHQIVWTKLAYNMGYTSPVNKNLGSDLDNLLQKAFFDRMWQVPLSEIVRMLKANGTPFDVSLPDSSKNLNEGKFSHMHENKSFQQMFLSELAGMLDVYKPIIQEAMLHLFEKNTGACPSKSDIDASKNNSLATNMIYNLFKMKKITTELPSYRVTSELYAAVRWDKEQKFESNDTHDFRHASAALPYCDYFFCEKGLSHLVTQKMLSHDKLYGCNVQPNVKSAVGVLENIQRA